MDLVAGANLVIPTTSLRLEIQIYGVDVSDLDFSAYCLSNMGKVRGDDDMIFYGQQHNQNKTVALNISNSVNFTVNLPQMDESIYKISVCATMADENKNFSALNYLDIKIKDGNNILVKSKIYGTNRLEAALIIGEIYKHKNDWKFRLVDQGFNGGLKPLAEHFGVEIADDNHEVGNTTIIDQQPEQSDPIPLETNTKSILQTLLESPFKAIEKRKKLKSFQSFISAIFLKDDLTDNDKVSIQNFCEEQGLSIIDSMDFVKEKSNQFIFKVAEIRSKQEINEWANFLMLSNSIIQQALNIAENKLESKFLSMLKKALSDGELNQQEINELNSFLRNNQLNQDNLMKKAQADISNFFHFNLASFIANESISKEEESLINNLCQYLKPNINLLNEIQEIITMVKRIEKIKKGDVTPIQTNEIIVKNSEIVFLHQKNVRIRATQKEILNGDLFVTNERIVFKSSKAIETSISNIISVDLSSDYVEIIAKTKRGSGIFHIGKEANIVNAYIDQSIRRFHRQLDLKQTSGQTRHIPSHVKNSVWVRCGGKCVQCSSTMYLEFDHIIPFSKGGSNSENNIQILCRSCNLNKSDRL